MAKFTFGVSKDQTWRVKIMIFVYWCLIYHWCITSQYIIIKNLNKNKDGGGRNRWCFFTITQTQLHHKSPRIIFLITESRARMILMGVTFFYYIRNSIWEAMDCLLYIWLLNIFQMKWYTENFIGLATDIKIKVEMLN